MSYSQNSEEQTILSYFGSSTGRFVEIGAYDPKVFSNTRALVELGWSGIYIEASKHHLKAFESEYEGNPNIQLIHAALSETDEPVTFYPSLDAVGTTDLNHKHKWEKTIPFMEAVQVPGYSIERLARETTGFDFLTLDTEGTSYELFSKLPDEYLKSLRLICIEHDSKVKEINHRLSRLGFKNLDLNGENVIYGK